MSLYPKQVLEYLALQGIPRGPSSKLFCYDPINGSDSNSGDRWSQPVQTLAAAYALTTANRNDCVLAIGGATATSPATALAWANSYTHLVGLSADLPGCGQRVRVTGTAALDLDYIVDFQGNGCVVKNVQFFQGNDAAEDSGAVIVSGSRNHFVNCFFAGMGHATAAARAGSYSLKITGAENAFERCTIGLATMCRGAANTELWMTGECNRNQFRNCEFVSWSVTAGKLAVKLDSSAVPYTTTFWDCLFHNLNSDNGASGGKPDNVFSDAATPMHLVILKDCMMVGFDGWADTATYLYSDGAVPNAGWGIAINPTT